MTFCNVSHFSHKFTIKKIHKNQIREGLSSVDFTVKLHGNQRGNESSGGGCTKEWGCTKDHGNTVHRRRRTDRHHIKPKKIRPRHPVVPIILPHHPEGPRQVHRQRRRAYSFAQAGNAIANDETMKKARIAKGERRTAGRT